MTPKRPNSIIWFERLFLVSILLSAIRAALNWIENATSGDLSVEGWSSFMVMQMAFTIVSFSISVALWFYIARRASNVAKWIFVAKTVLGVASTAWLLVSLSQRNIAFPNVFSTSFIQLLVVFALSFLFRQDAKVWFQTKGQPTSLGKTFE